VHNDCGVLTFGEGTVEKFIEHAQLVRASSSQRGAGNATYVYPDGGFQIFQNGKLIINKIK